MTVPRWAAGLAIGAALLGSGALVATAPDNDALTAPFFERGGLGETVSGRHLTAVVDSVRLTEYLDVKYAEAPDTTTDGVWVIVDATLTPRLDTLSMGEAQLWIGDVRYHVSDILPAPSPLRLAYGADIPQRGSLVFEIPRAALDDPGAARASIVLQHAFDSRLDSVPVVVVDLTRLEISARERIEQRRVAEQ